MWDVLGMGALAFVAGYLVHELLHMVPLWLAGAEYEMRVGTPEDGVLKGLFLRGVRIQSDTDGALTAVSAAAPLVAFIPALLVYVAVLLNPNATFGAIMVTGAFLVASAPSIVDIQAIRWGLQERSHA